MAISMNKVNEMQGKELFEKQNTAYFKKGVITALISGLYYGIYSAFLTAGEGSGIWTDFWGLSIAGTLVGYCLLCAVGAGVNDFFSGIWMMIIAAAKGKLGDVFRTFKTRPGAVMVVCALIGGPIANTAYIVGLMMAGGIAAAITALCAAIGAIIGRIVFKQKLNFRMIVGILICFAAAVIIGSTGGSEVRTSSLLGCFIAFIAALGWGIEGSVAGYATCMIDNEVGITIRQITSGLANLIVLVPILILMTRATHSIPDIQGNMYTFLVGGAMFSGAIVWFLVSGFFSGRSFGLWYKGNSMCGAALGMTCNALYSFWVPLFMWLLCGVILGWDGYTLTPIQWTMALVEVFGIWLIAMNPLDLFRKKEVA